jgi:hypothetical protein
MGKYAIIIVLTVLVTLSIYGYGLQRTWMSADIAAVEVYNNSQARNIAQSSAMVAIQKIIVDEDENFKPEEDETILIPASVDSFRTWDAMRGEYRYQIRNLGDSLVTVAARSRFRGSEYEIEVVLEKASNDWDPDLSHAVFARTSLTMTGSARIYGDAGTNSTAAGAVNLSWSTKIDSSLSIGPGGNPSTVVIEANFQQGNVGGEVVNLPSIKNFPLPEFPEYPVKDDIVSNITISGGGGAVTLNPDAYDGKYIPTLRIQSNKVLQLATGNVDRVLHVGHLDITQGHLDILGTGKLTIYVENQITLGGSSSANRYRLPETMFIYYGGTNALSFTGSTGFRGGLYAETANITLGGSGGIQGNIITGGSSVTISGNAEANSRVIYAPNAAFTLNGSGRVRGSIVCDTFVAVGGTRVVSTNQYDDEFPLFPGGGESKMVVRRWR